MSNVIKRTHMCGTLSKANIDERVVLNGWIQKEKSRKFNILRFKG